MHIAKGGIYISIDPVGHGYSVGEGICVISTVEVNKGC